MIETNVRLPNNWKPRPDQMKLWRYLIKGGTRAVEVAHRRWGKDDVSLHFTATAAMRKVGNYWHLLPQYNQCRKAIWDAVNPRTGMRRIDEAFPASIRTKTRETDMMIKFAGGSTWQLVGSDNFNALVGSPPRGVVFSEFALSDPKCWAYLSPILEENGGWAAFISTSRGPNHLMTMLRFAQETPGWFGEVLTADDTPVFGKDQIDQIHAEMIATHGPTIGEALFQQEYYCSFDVISANCFFAGALDGHDFITKGTMASIKDEDFVPDPNGIIEVWRYPYQLLKGYKGEVWKHRYCIGTDISEGLDGDYSVAYVYDRHVKEIVARMRSNKIDSYRWADRVNDLALQYGNALVVPERSGAGITTVNRLLELKSNLYIKEVIAGIGSQITKQFGFVQTKEAKQSICGMLKAYLGGTVRKAKVYDQLLIDECKVFIKDEGRELLGAEAGFHDDAVIAAALALVGDEYLPKCEQIKEGDRGWVARWKATEKSKAVWAN